MIEYDKKSVFVIRHSPSGLYLPDARSHFSQDCDYVPFEQARTTANRAIAIRRLSSWLQGPFKTKLEYEPSDEFGDGFYYRTEPICVGPPRNKDEFALDEFYLILKVTEQ